MKKLNFASLGLVFILPLASICQPTITSSFNPVAGTNIKIASADTIGVNEGPAGANKTYDFSKIKMSGSTGSYTYQTAASSPYTAQYPSANLALATTSTGGNTGYTYIKTTSADHQYLGLATSATKLVYSDHQLIYKFPMTMGSNANDKFAGTSTSSGLITHRSGTLSYLADGYGILKLPKATFQNILRVKTVQYIKDSTYFEGFDFVFEYYITTYNFLSNDFKQQLLGISYSTTEDAFGGMVTTKSVSYYPETSAVENIAANTSFSIYPNPATNFFNLNLTFPDIQNIRVELKDLTGKTITLNQNSISENMSVINTSNIPDGIYFVYVYCNSVRFAPQKLVVANK